MDSLLNTTKFQKCFAGDIRSVVLAMYCNPFFQHTFLTARFMVKGNLDIQNIVKFF